MQAMLVCIYTLPVFLLIHDQLNIKDTDMEQVLFWYDVNIHNQSAGERKITDMESRFDQLPTGSSSTPPW